MLSLYDRIVDPDLLVRRIFLVTNHVIEETGIKGSASKDSLISGGLKTGILSGTDRGRNLGRKQESPRQTEETEREGGSAAAGSWQQLDLFTDYEVLEAEKEREKAALEKERRLQEAMLEIRRKYGKNAILKGTSLQEGATMRDRNQSIGGHKA